MAKKKGLAKHRRRRKSATPRKNPPLGTDLTKTVAPAFGAYVATRLLSRIVYQLVARKWPKAGKHAAVGSAVASFSAAWWAAHRIEKLEEYHDAIVVGSGIAAGQAVVRNYLPAWGWIVGDLRPEDVGQAAEGQTSASPEEVAMLEGFGADSLTGLSDAGDGLGADDEDDLSDLEAELGLGSLGAGDDDAGLMH